MVQMRNKNGEDNLRNFFKRWPVFYYFIATIFGPLMFSGLSAKKFLKNYHQSGKVLNIGSGPLQLGTDVINIDVYPHKGVDIVADALSIPVADNSISRIVSDNVLEHIADPRAAIKEMYRILAPGGIVYVCIPFLYPFHPSPSDFQRFTKEGIMELMKDFEVLEIGIRAGPFSALTVNLCYLFATIFSFGLEQLYLFLVNALFFVLWPIKLLDIIFNHWPRAINMAAVLYCVARKK